MSGIRVLLEAWSRQGRRTIHEADTKAVLGLAGIPLPGAPVPGASAVVKLASDRFPHKTEHGLVRLGVPAGEVPAVGAEMRRRVHDGTLLVERMVEGAVAEWIVGCKHDATFGPVVVAGPGGVLVEIIDEVEIRLAPAGAETARGMLAGRAAGALLAGARGKPAGDAEALVELIVQLSSFVAEHGDLIAEIELNPVLVLPRGQGVVAADALMILKHAGEEAQR